MINNDDYHIKSHNNQTNLRRIRMNICRFMKIYYTIYYTLLLTKILLFWFDFIFNGKIFFFLLLNRVYSLITFQIISGIIIKKKKKIFFFFI